MADRKNNIRFLRRPVWREAFSVKCFISKHSSVKLNIDTFAATESGEHLFEARTELCAADPESGRPRKEQMLFKLKEHTGCENVVTFGSIKRKYDVYICDDGGNATVKLLKKLYRNDIYH